MRKRIVTALLMVCMSLSMAACGGNDDLREENEQLRQELEELKKELKNENKPTKEERDEEGILEGIVEKEDKEITEEEKIPSFEVEKEGVCGPDLTWKYGSGILVIEGKGAMTDFSYSKWRDENEAPWSEMADSIIRIYVKEGVTTLGKASFCGLYKLSYASLPDSLTLIGDCAFANCHQLSIDRLPETVTSIGDWAFEDCKQLSIDRLPEALTSIGSSAFENAESIETLTFPKNLEVIGNEAFAYTKLKEIDLSNTKLTELDNSFSGENIEKVILPDTLRYVSECAIRRTSSEDYADTQGNGPTNTSFYKVRVNKYREVVRGESISVVWKGITYYDNQSLVIAMNEDGVKRDSDRELIYKKIIRVLENEYEDGMGEIVGKVVYDGEGNCYEENYVEIDREEEWAD